MRRPRNRIPPEKVAQEWIKKGVDQDIFSIEWISDEKGKLTTVHVGLLFINKVVEV